MEAAVQAHEEEHLEEGPEDVGHALGQRHGGDHEREEAVEDRGANHPQGLEHALVRGTIRGVEIVRDVCRVVHRKAASDEDVDRRSSVDRRMRPFFILSSVEREAEHIHDRIDYAEERHEGELRPWNHHAHDDAHNNDADDEVTDEFLPNHPDLLPVYEVAAEDKRIVDINDLCQVLSHSFHRTIPVGTGIKLLLQYREARARPLDPLFVIAFCTAVREELILSAVVAILPHNCVLVSAPVA